MTIFAFVNNVSTTLAGAISPSSTTMTLASTANLPLSIPSGQSIAITLNDQATRGVFEIVYATAITGSTLTIVRGREGTAALSWLVGDFVYSPPTAGQMLNAMQIPQATGRLLSPPTILTASGNFTPNPAATLTIVEGIGGGAASGGCAATTSSTAAASAGGSCGSYAKAAFVGALSGVIACVIGAGGAIGAAGGIHGGDGGTTTFGTLLTCPGGDGGVGSPALSAGFVNAVGGSVHLPTTTGQMIVAVGTALGGPGLVLGVDSGMQKAGDGTPCIYGFPASGYGGGAVGVFNFASQAAKSGIAGRHGVLIIWEFS